ncbi:IniB N-terminal domain-containing protein [Microbacterium caowuchunii]|uniref:Uncharacterized protein n=1 Tax=Microbacterium caowuchunii TaxID=2614638 RepID=A0A5N0TNM5_9MICO|nr:IniB N-terminal domain-containing protein [Microbacterium caowuchunii]KAA9135506.1 hypothetical protein F6B40_03040 [Microbacterium caowuchunii]
MSVTLATMADALIEFILSLLRDPDAAAEFDADPGGAMSSRGLTNVRYDDVCAVAPVVVDRAAVVPRPDPAPAPAPQPSPDPVINEIRSIVNNFAWIDDRDTIVDQSVNQNIWAEGDVTQNFDQAAIVASGDDAIAAGDDVDIDQSRDDSTTITAGGDANVGNETTSNTTNGSYNESTDASTTTDASNTTIAVGSGNDSSTNTTATDSFDSSTTTYLESTSDMDSTIVYDSTDTLIADTTADDQF